MTLLVLGLNYRTAPLELRERLSIDPDRLGPALDSLARQVAPGVILSTCNRLEIYTLVDSKSQAESKFLADSKYDASGNAPITTWETAPGNADESLRRLQDFIADYSGIPRSDLQPLCYHHQEGDCVKHLFRVSSGLDSMVVGEWEILGQVRAAFSAASEPGYVRGPLSRLFHQALRVGRRVHHDANIGSNRRRSVSQVGVQLAYRTLGDLSQRQVLLIGAGDAGQLAGRALAAAGAGNLVVTNRTYGRAAELSQELGGVAAPFEQLYQTLVDSDAVISTTASPDYLLRRPEVQEVMERRGGRPLLLIDIAVPRDIEPEVGLLEGVSLCDIDSLRATSEDGNAGIEPEVAQAEELVAGETEKFLNWWESIDTISAIATVREYAENIRRAEVNKTLAKLKSQWPSGPDSGPNSDNSPGGTPQNSPNNVPDLDALAAQLDAMTSALVKKLLHHPTVYLREGKDPTRQQMVLELFNPSNPANSTRPARPGQPDQPGQPGQPGQGDRQHGRG